MYINKRKEERKNYVGRTNDIEPEDEVLLFLIHFRHYPVDLMLSSIFGRILSATQRYREKMLDWFYSMIHHTITFPTIDERHASAVKIGYQYFTFSVDGSEQPTTSCADPFLNTEFYSAKKKMHSVNIVVFVNLKGRIIWISPSYPGSWNDEAILKDTVNEWYPHLLKYEYGLGDKGFRGMQHLNLVPTPPRGTELYKLHCHYRILSENRFRDTKIYRVCKVPLRIPLLQKERLLKMHNKYWVVACGFVNSYIERSNL
jgi:hypothetical protein